MNNQYDLAILGAGSAGLVAAATACGMGARVLLVENKKMGGDCLNYGCVPSKAFLKCCKIANCINHASQYGITTQNTNVSIEKIMQRVKDIIAQIAPHDSAERFTSLGAHVVQGHGEILSANSVKVGNNIYSTRKIIIATGSTAAVYPIEGINNVNYYTNENIFDLKILPKNMVVLGAGPIGLELGQGFSFLGSNVHIIDMAPTIFNKDEPEVSKLMVQSLENDGIKLHLSSKILKIENKDSTTIVTIEKDSNVYELECDTLLVALGRKPNTANIGLENAGIVTNAKGFITVNDKLQTSAKNIYACGDVRGKYLFTHTAGYEAGVAVKNALIAPIFKTSYKNIAWATYTSPEVAHVGLTEKECDKNNVTVHFIDIYANDRAKTDNDKTGFVKLILNKKGIVIGATIVSEKASEMIVQLSVMLANRITLSSALNVIYQYPIQGEIVKTLAINKFKDNVKPWQQSLIKKIVNKGDKK